MHDAKLMDHLIRDDDTAVYGDKGYASGAKKRAAEAAGVLWAVKEKAKPGGRLTARPRARNHRFGKVRAKVEHVFRVVKCQFGYRKVRYRGIAKNGAQVFSLLALLSSILSRDGLTNRMLANGHQSSIELGGLHTRAQSMAAVCEQIRQRPAPSSVIIQGAAGSGKKQAARALHNLGSRANGPFVVWDLRATPLPDQRQVLDEKIAEAGAGTLVLEEITLLESGLERQLGTRIVGFVWGFASSLPPAVDVPADHGTVHDPVDHPGAADPRRAARRHCASGGRLRRRILGQVRQAALAHSQRNAQQLLEGYPWPGNVGELRSKAAQAVALATGEALEPRLLPKMVHNTTPGDRVLTIAIPTPLSDVERALILRTLEAQEVAKTASAEALGISRRSIYNKLATYGLEDKADGLEDRPDTRV